MVSDFWILIDLFDKRYKDSLTCRQNWAKPQKGVIICTEQAFGQKKEVHFSLVQYSIDFQAKMYVILGATTWVIGE